MEMFNQYLFEFIGTMVLILLGDGVCAATSLNKSKAKGAGWIVITMGWGFAVMVGVFIAGSVSGAHLNPAVSIGCAMAGTMAWSAVPGYVIAQMLGGFVGAVLVWMFYKDHYDLTEDPDTKLGTFCTMPAIEGHKVRNFFCEAIATWLLVFVILVFSLDANIPTLDAEGYHLHIGMGELGAIPVTYLIMAIGMSLGGATGYALNPARDLSPRIAHAILPMKNKRESGWAYSWVPVAGPVAGAALAALTYILIY
ncbi:MAG: aquaporin family protein [Bacteroidales bacterium]|nr:aquaporin family protein [Bacteroidales bacterium]